MRLKARLLVVVVSALVGCGGDDDDGGGNTRTTSTEKTASSRPVPIKVDGRTLSGHCRGEKGDGPAVMLEVGMAQDANQHQLSGIEDHVAKRTVVCAYDRAGVGGSDVPPDTPRQVTDVLGDTEAFIDATKVPPPYVLVGFSAGGAIAFMYAQAHPDTVKGFVSINPVPPAKPFVRLARKVETREEYASELAFYGGENEESIDFGETERMLTDPLPAAMPYAVMFDEDCDGDTQFCRRILPPLTSVTKMLTTVGKGGRFVPAKGAGHDIDQTRPELVYKTIDSILAEAGGG